MTAVTDRLAILNDFCATNAEHITDDNATSVELSRAEAGVQLVARGNAAATVAWAVDVLTNPVIMITATASHRHVGVTGTWHDLKIRVVSLTEDRNDALRVDLHVEWTVENTRGAAVISPEKLREIAAEVIA